MLICFDNGYETEFHWDDFESIFKRLNISRFGQFDICDNTFNHPNYCEYRDKIKKYSFILHYKGQDTRVINSIYEVAIKEILKEVKEIGHYNPAMPLSSYVVFECIYPHKPNNSLYNAIIEKEEEDFRCYLEAQKIEDEEKNRRKEVNKKFHKTRLIAKNVEHQINSQLFNIQKTEEAYLNVLFIRIIKHDASLSKFRKTEEQISRQVIFDRKTTRKQILKKFYSNLKKYFPHTNKKQST